MAARPRLTPELLAMTPHFERHEMMHKLLRAQKETRAASRRGKKGRKSPDRIGARTAAPLDGSPAPAYSVGDTPFHAHNHDLEHLEKWVETMLQNERARREPECGWLEYYQVQTRQYSACFEELSRQTSFHCGVTARLLNKVWAGMFAMSTRILQDFQIQREQGAIVTAQLGVLQKHTETAVAREQLLENQRYLRDGRLQDVISTQEMELGVLRREMQEREEQAQGLREIIVKYVEAAERRARADAGEEDGEGRSKVTVFSPQRLAAASKEHEDRLADADARLSESLVCIDGEQARQLAMLDDLQSVTAAVHSTIESVVGAVRGPEVCEAAAQTDLWVPTLEPEEKEEEAEKPPPPPPRPPDKTKGAHMPVALRPLMDKFPNNKRVLARKAVNKLIAGILVDKIDADTAHDEAGAPRQSMGEYLYSWMSNRYGLRSLADWHATQLVASVQHYKDETRIRLFGDMIGAFDVEAPPVYDARDVRFFFQYLRQLRARSEFNHAAAENADGVIRITVANALSVVRHSFERMPVNELLNLIHNLPVEANKREVRSEQRINFDEVSRLVMAHWVELNRRWRGELQALFERHATWFANDPETGLEAEIESQTDPPPGAYQRLAFDGFTEVARAVDNDLEDDEIALLFEGVCEDVRAQRQAKLDERWRKMHDDEQDRDYYVDTHEFTTQWEPPYDPEDLLTQELQLEDMLAQILRRGLLENAITGITSQLTDADRRLSRRRSSNMLPDPRAGIRAARSRVGSRAGSPLHSPLGSPRSAGGGGGSGGSSGGSNTRRQSRVPSRSSGRSLSPARSRAGSINDV